MNAAIEFRDVSFRYNRAPVLDDVNLQVTPGEFLAVVGPNGAGKTTLLKLMLGLLSPSAGTVEVLQQDPVESRQQIGYVPQFAGFNRDFPINVTQVVLTGRLGNGFGLGRYRREDRDAAQRALVQVNIEALKSRSIASLSGGQLQRVLIARALACEPEILLLDEPTANVDFRAEEALFDQLKSLTPEKTVLVVSHDIGFISRYVSRVACVNRQLVCHTSAELTPEAIESLYGEPMRMVHSAHHHGHAP